MGRKKHTKKAGKKSRSGDNRSGNLAREILAVFSASPAKSFSDKQIINKFLEGHKRAAIQEAIISLLESERLVVSPPGKLKLTPGAAKPSMKAWWT